MFSPSSRANASAYIGSMKLLLVVVWLALSIIGQARAASVPEGFSDKQIANSLNSPTSVTVLPDGRVLVTQQNGIIRIIKGDAMLPDNFYAVQNVDSYAERGCLGITSDPNFAANHFLYIYCTLKDGERSFNRILRVTEANDRAVAGSEYVVLTLPDVPTGVRWHMGGALHFGVDGKLYVAVGGHEETWLPPETSNSQNLANPFGKILRINADGSIPGDNPYVNTPGAYRANFNIGLRNPFSFDIQPGTGLMYINDVGAGEWEEINKGMPGANYGWPDAEGMSTNSRYTNPVYTYSHHDGCAITGGAFYNPPKQQFPDSYVGKYLFADFCSGAISFIDPAAPATAHGFATGIDYPVGLVVSPDGSLYYLARNQSADVAGASVGSVGKISFTNTKTPRITLQPQTQTIFLGAPVTFTVKADDATAIQWQRNGVAIAGATSASYTIPAVTQADNHASFTAVLRNAFGSTTSNPAILTVTTDRSPVATITSPPEDSRFTLGETITYTGTATDAEDGVVPPAAYIWQVDFMHNTHSHPFIAATSGATSGTLTVPAFESDSANTWLRISLTVIDSQGQTGTAIRDIYPSTQISDMTPAATPVNGLGPVEKNKNNGDAAAGDGTSITLNGIPYAKGLGVHAPSDVRYLLGGTCSGNLVTDVGVDDSVGNQGSVVFQVWLDGAIVFDSGLMHGGDLRKSVNISVAGKNELRLVVTDGGDGNVSDRADWAAARVTGCQTSAPASAGS